MTVRNFIELVGAGHPHPAECFCWLLHLSAGLGAMMGWMSYGNKIPNILIQP
jgi:hypothetical protein